MFTTPLADCGTLADVAFVWVDAFLVLVVERALVLREAEVLPRLLATSACTTTGRGLGLGFATAVTPTTPTTSVATGAAAAAGAVAASEAAATSARGWAWAGRAKVAARPPEAARTAVALTPFCPALLTMVESSDQGLYRVAPRWRPEGAVSSRVSLSVPTG